MTMVTVAVSTAFCRNGLDVNFCCQVIRCLRQTGDSANDDLHVDSMGHHVGSVFVS